LAQNGHCATEFLCPLLGVKRTVDQADASCCYAKSDKSWVKDPSGVSWETFFTFGAATVYGEDTIEDERAAYSRHLAYPNHSW
jgi:hypothetical protein